MNNVLEYHQVIDRKYSEKIFNFSLSIVSVPQADDLAHVYDEKLRLLRKLKPEYFDSQGNLLSYNTHQTRSKSQQSAPSSNNYSLRNRMPVFD